LECVFHILVIAKHFATHDPHQSAVPLDDLGKRPMIAVLHKPHQKFAVGRGDRVAISARRHGFFAAGWFPREVHVSSTIENELPHQAISASLPRIEPRKVWKMKKGCGACHEIRPPIVVNPLLFKHLQGDCPMLPASKNSA
jgi:hypothetical protein